jgi:hypothetical protein
MLKLMLRLLGCFDVRTALWEIAPFLRLLDDLCNALFFGFSLVSLGLNALRLSMLRNPTARIGEGSRPQAPLMYPVRKS